MVVAIIMGIQHASRLELKKGDNHGMVAEIKVYLQRLGYNAIAGAKAEKENGLFDERLETAVRVYQSSFNLPVTGFLNAPTIQSLSLPRCGREDAHAPLILLRLIKSKPWNLITRQNKWSSNGSNLTYAISSTICSPILSDHDIQSAIVATFDSLATVVPLSFREVDSLEEAMIKIQFDGDGDGEWVFEFI
ncbi:metalloendoproteinase 1-MMP-like [Cryptomeria japonica]|uniref:metalloendoproteinase 1-MMP-like n=1 Tax=Cryptomeria japonica TaxID=3369 RepID=UPI0027DAB377|nr:metalloendoproteinase 1-MMP-like [Cryptomeria japonica]